MIEPADAVPAKAIKMVNGRRLSLSAFSVIMILDKPAEELNIHDYSIFRGDTMDTDALYRDLAGLGPYRYLTCICHNLANPDATPAGSCSYSITTLPRVDGWKTVKAEDYDKVKHQVANQLIEYMNEYLGFDLRDHVLECVIETPMTVAHYTDAWNGCIYGYSHTMDDHIVARLQTAEDGYLLQWEGDAFDECSCQCGVGEKDGHVVGLRLRVVGHGVDALVAGVEAVVYAVVGLSDGCVGIVGRGGSGLDGGA